jgi:hypothetical protein
VGAKERQPRNEVQLKPLKQSLPVDDFFRAAGIGKKDHTVLVGAQRLKASDSAVRFSPQKCASESTRGGRRLDRSAIESGPTQQIETFL